MKTVEISEIASLLENYGDAEQPLILTRDGQPIAALVPVEAETDLETLSLSLNPKFVELIERSRQSQKEEGRVFLEDIPLAPEV
jgi:PHD/YefM family antitoxin component YafN of YafNO toxin-antitoxin module